MEETEEERTLLTKVLTKSMNITVRLQDFCYRFALDELRSAMMIMQRRGRKWGLDQSHNTADKIVQSER